MKLEPVDFDPFTEDQGALATSPVEPVNTTMQNTYNNVMQAITFNRADEIAAAAAVPLLKLKPEYADKSIGELYDIGLQAYRNREAFESKNANVIDVPLIGTVKPSSVFGTVTGAVINPANKFLPLASTTKGALGVGAGMGAAYASGASESGPVSNPTGYLVDTGIGAALGGGLNVAATKAINYLQQPTKRLASRMLDLVRGKAETLDVNVTMPSSGLTKNDILGGLGNLSDDAIRTYKDGIAKGMTPEQVQRLVLLKENQLPVNSAVVTQDAGQQALQDMARKGALSPEAKVAADNYARELRGSIADRVQSVKTGLGDETANLATTGTAVQEAIQTASKTAREAKNQAYTELAKMGKVGVSLDSLQAVKQTSDNVAERYAIDRLPAVKDTINKINKFFPKETAKGYGDLNKVIKFREIINAEARTAPVTDDATHTALKEIRESLDDALDDAVANNLIRGNKNAVGQFKEANSLARDYIRNFKADKVIRTIDRNDLTGEQVADLLVKSSNLGGQKAAVGTIDKLETILGKEAPELGSLRSLIFERNILGQRFTNALGEVDEALVGDLSAKTVLQNLNRFKSENNTLWEKLYSPEQRNEITSAIRAMAIATNKVPGGANYSNTAPFLMRAMRAIGQATPLVGESISRAVEGFQKQGQSNFAIKSFLGDIEPAKRQLLTGAKTSQLSGAVAGNAIKSTQQPALESKPLYTLEPIDYDPFGGTPDESPIPDSSTTPFQINQGEENMTPQMETTIRKAEGERFKVYKDTVGKRTVGVGFNMDSPNARKVWETAGIKTSFDDVLNGKTPITKADSDALLRVTMETAEKDARKLVPNFDTHPENVQSAIIEMSFQLGKPTLSQFKRTLNAIKKGQYELAAKFLKQSKYATQTPNRVNRIASTLTA